ncbi:Ger(x)C family spore germination protein [Paenibacillus sp. HJGM_3]|uniref:Ger(x)C family spore germination protein n=1 Tax=Paenibacillus sp. HJGM_3 TaxID=3379816 RepID=UPI00385BD11F
MRRNLYVICCLILVSLMLAGCWDRRELNEIAIAVGMGLDKDGAQVRISSQLVNPGEVASTRNARGYSTPVTVYSATEATTLEALKKLTTMSPRQIFSSHLRVLVIGEELARQGIADILDGLSRMNEFRTDFFILVARNNSAMSILETLTPSEKIPANGLYTMLNTSAKTWAPTVKMTLDKVMSDISNPTKDSVLSGIRIIGNESAGHSKSNLERTHPAARLQNSGLALFKKGRLIDWMNEEESKGYNYIRGNVKRTAGHLTCPEGGTVGVEVIRTKSKVKGKVRNGKPQISVDLFVEQDIGEVKCKLDLSKEETIRQLEKISVQKLKDILEAAIRKAQKNKADIFGFGEAIEDADPRTWLRIKDDWDRYFGELDVTVHVDAPIRRTGTISNSAQGKE